MKLLILFLALFQITLADTAVDPRYDNYDGETLVLKLIEDNQWESARQVFTKEKESFLKTSPSDYYLIQGLLQQQSGNDNDSILSFEKSLSLKYSPLALEKISIQFLKTGRWADGLTILETHQKSAFGKNMPSEISFLKSAASHPEHLARILAWSESFLKNSFQFPLFKFYIEELAKNKITHEAVASINTAMDQGKIKSAEEVLTLAECFLALGLDTEIHSFLEKARMQFPNNELIKLNLAQVLFKKDLYFNALNLLSELKMDDGVLNVQLELMNIMHIKSYSLFHRMNLKDGSQHLKNWFVYFINNEDWAQLYSLHPQFAISDPQAKWKTDDFNYAMAYSAQLLEDPSQARVFIDKVTSPNLAQKKANLLKSLNL